jgi:tetratricopeptide (TPR) repeat protein
MRAPVVAYTLLVLLWLPEYNRTINLWKDEVALYTASLENHPGNIEVRANLSGHYLDSNQLNKAAELLKESLTMAPHDPVLVKNRFEQLWQTGPASLALSFLDKHKELCGADYLYRRGRLLEATGKLAEAIESYQKAAAQAKDPELRFTAGIQHAKLLYESGDAEKGKRILKGLIREFPDRPELELLSNL